MRKKGLKLLFAAALLFFALNLLIFVKRQLPAYDQIERQGMETDALFYTESPEAMERHFQLMQKK